MRRSEPGLGKDRHETPSPTTTPIGDPREDSQNDSPNDVFHDCISERLSGTPGNVRHVASASPQRLAEQEDRHSIYSDEER